MKKLELADPTLLREAAFIDGAWCAADDAARVRILNPANGDLVGEVPLMRAAETRRAIEAATRAQAAWARRTAKERAVILRRFADLMLANTADLAIIMTAEQGKPLAEAKGEVAY
ncbi:MAG: aldehyde dehydrogenase family protein, partial [Gammaproteobacteria bacterium]|nr:aldehyde dehydrogenase family protein [Gammaproteobacteria bacterium]